jgi:hypothetical protein
MDDRIDGDDHLRCPSTMANMKQALKQLLNALDRIYENNEELGDTAVREQMYEAVYKSFIDPQAGYALPEEFGMFSAAANKKVKAALEKFLAHPQVIVAAKELKTPKERLDAFQDADVESSEGNIYEEYFGAADET